MIDPALEYANCVISDLRRRIKLLEPDNKEMSKTLVKVTTERDQFRDTISALNVNFVDKVRECINLSRNDDLVCKLHDELAKARYEIKQWKDLVKVMEDKATDTPNTETWSETWSAVLDLLESVKRQISGTDLRQEPAYIHKDLLKVHDMIDKFIRHPKGWTHTD